MANQTNSLPYGSNEMGAKTGEWLFKMRDYTPIPLILTLFVIEAPTVWSATLGTLCVLFGELWRIYSVAFIGTVSRTRSHSLGQKLIVEGPFKWVRNPLYLGNFLIAFGFAIFSGVYWFMLLTLAAFVLQYHFIVQYEEKNLLRVFGSEYQEFRKTVPAWFPKKFPHLSDVDWPLTYSASLKSEKRTLTSIVFVLGFAVFFSL